MRTSDRTPLVLAAAYFANFGALASSAPFLALLLRDAGLDDSVAAVWLAVFLLARWIAIPAWTWLADRMRSIPRVLQIVTLGAAIAIAPLLVPMRAAIVIAALVAFAAFRAPFGPLLDSYNLSEEAAGGARFGRLRAWGTAGYTLGALATGALIARGGNVRVVHTTLFFLACAVVASFALPGRAPMTTRTHAPLGAILRRPRFVALLAVATLHQVGLAPYDVLFPAWFAPFAGATAAGVAIALGAGAEFVFMIAGASLPARWSAEALLKLACIGSSIRWAIVGFTRDPLVLVGAQVFHALTFGAFFLASVRIVDREFSAEKRTLGQGIFTAWTWGIAAALALALAGFVQRAWGIAGVFRVAAIASLVAAAIPLGRAQADEGGSS